MLLKGMNFPPWSVGMTWQFLSQFLLPAVLIALGNCVFFWVLVWNVTPSFYIVLCYAVLCCTHFVDLDCIPTTASFTPPTILHTLASYMHLHMYTSLQTYTAVCSQTSGAMHMIATWCHLAVMRAFI